MIFKPSDKRVAATAEKAADYSRLMAMVNGKMFPPFRRHSANRTFTLLTAYHSVEIFQSNSINLSIPLVSKLFTGCSAAIPIKFFKSSFRLLTVSACTGFTLGMSSGATTPIYIKVIKGFNLFAFRARLIGYFTLKVGFGESSFKKQGNCIRSLTTTVVEVDSQDAANQVRAQDSLPTVFQTAYTTDVADFIVGKVGKRPPSLALRYGIVRFSHAVNAPIVDGVVRLVREFVAPVRAVFIIAHSVVDVPRFTRRQIETPLFDARG